MDSVNKYYRALPPLRPLDGLMQALCFLECTGTLYDPSCAF